MSTRLLVTSFVAWKTLLLLAALAPPIISYDTSSSWAFDDAQSAPSVGRSLASVVVEHVPRRLLNWDAVYYAAIAHRGYRHEQDWAFSWGWTKLLSSFHPSTPVVAACFAVVLANLSHLLSVLVLYRLALLLLGRRDAVARSVARVAALLHVVAPAGIFLSAPYGESLFALLNFSGMLCYAAGAPPQSLESGMATRQNRLVVLAGALIGLATTVRSNGILSGIIFAHELLAMLPTISPRRPQALRRAFCLVVAGVLVAVGYIVPQLVAYADFCLGRQAQARRAWCTSLPPSIFTFVQSHYWNVGFGRYWTLSNLPLFLLAAPMLMLMTLSAVAILFARPAANAQSGKKPSQNDSLHHTLMLPLTNLCRTSDATTCLQRLVLPQLAVAVLAFTSFHVQIITRIGSGYPILYLYVASGLVGKNKVTVLGYTGSLSKLIVRWMVIYALIQGALFARFLPPA